MEQKPIQELQRDRLETLLTRVAEVEALFVLVRRIVPFVQDLARFVQDVAPMLRKASQSLRESSNKMPRAAEHLSNVTEATELATSEVLDRLDGILTTLPDLEAMADAYASFRRNFSANCRRLDRIAEDLQQGRMRPDEGALAISKLVTRMQRRAKDLPAPASLRRHARTVRDQAYEIMTALQVQDITAQQLMAAYELIRSVQEKINGLLNDLFDVDGELVPRKDVAYDAGATFLYRSSARRRGEGKATAPKDGGADQTMDDDSKRARTQADVDEILRQIAHS